MKLKQWYVYPQCDLLKYYDVGKVLVQAKLSAAQAKEFRSSLFANLTRDEKIKLHLSLLSLIEA